MTRTSRSEATPLSRNSRKRLNAIGKLGNLLPF
jgi:hypothetical protein